MLSKEQINSFYDRGYLLIPNVLNSSEIEYLRTRICSIFETGEWKKSKYNTETVLSDVYNTFSEFIDITINAKMIGFVKDLLKTDIVLMPETGIINA